jgi:hypothetical protein
MKRAIPLVLALTAAPMLALPRAARADASSAKTLPVYVLTVQTDDSDDQAEALTQALRWRVRQAPGWSLLETSQSFETLSIALKCPPKPDNACLGRIGDQLHTDRFVWGTLSKAGGGQVKADLHLWARGKPDTVAQSTYTDNLKDASDESLRAVATGLFATLSGTSAGAAVVIHAGNGGGDVLVDGAVRGKLDGGSARIDVPAGSHTIAVRVPGYATASQPANVQVGADQELTFSLTSAGPAPVEGGPSKPFPARKVLEYGAIIVGGGLLIVSGVETAGWINDSNQSNTDRQHVPANINDVCSTQVNSYAQDACNKSHDAQTVSALAWTFGVAGAAVLGTGIILMLTDQDQPSTETGGAASAKPRRNFDVTPSFGPQGGSIALKIAF